VTIDDSNRHVTVTDISVCAACRLEDFCDDATMHGAISTMFSNAGVPFEASSVSRAAAAIDPGKCETDRWAVSNGMIQGFGPQQARAAFQGQGCISRPGLRFKGSGQRKPGYNFRVVFFHHNERNRFCA
jgi:hypothetical protein